MPTPKRKAIAITTTIVILLRIETKLAAKLNEVNVSSFELRQGQDQVAQSSTRSNGPQASVSSVISYLNSKFTGVSISPALLQKTRLSCDAAARFVTRRLPSLSLTWNSRAPAESGYCPEETSQQHPHSLLFPQSRSSKLICHLV